MQKAQSENQLGLVILSITSSVNEKHILDFLVGK